jgi:formiminoglutamase
MNLNDYFEPVSLEKPEMAFRWNDELLGRNIKVHTANNPIDEISNYHVAIFGVQEDRNSGNTGSADAPDRIRAKLYELSRINEKLRIIDLGNLKKTAQVNDVYFGVRDVLIDLLNNQVTAIVLGGTQDITQGLYMAFELAKESVNLVTIDSRLDMEAGSLGHSTWLAQVMKNKKLFSCTGIAQQQYLLSKKHSEEFDEKSFDLVRLGAVRSNAAIAEPFLRDAHLVSMDISAVKQGDAPATKYSSPNGLLAEEACLLARYAGLSEQVSCFGIFEVNPAFDRNDQTSHLAAQTAWYFMEGFAQRKREMPSATNSDFKVFMVNHHDMEHALTFYKSQVTGRWWMEVPVIKSGKPVIVSCSVEEYQQACNHEIPELWWKAFQKIN